MPLSINTNVASLNAQRSFFNSNAQLETAFERLSTGKRVNAAVDDAAGLAIGKDLESRVRGLNQAVRNVNDGISMVQVAEGTLDEVTSILQRMRDLAVQASSDGIGDTERGYLDTEHSKLATTLEAVVNQAKFNDKDLIDYDGTSFSIQSGADSGEVTTLSIGGVSDSILAVGANDITLNAAQNERIVFDDFVLGVDGIYTVTVTASGGGTSQIASDDQTFADTAALATNLNTKTALYNFSAEDGQLVATYVAAGNGTNTKFEIAGDGGAAATPDTAATIYNGTTTSRDSASAAIDVIDTALDSVAKERAKLGATQAQLESTVRNLANVAENTSAAAGRIMDTDYAAETANLTKAQILQQAATSILAQANAQPQSVLALLR